MSGRLYPGLESTKIVPQIYSLCKNFILGKKEPDSWEGVSGQVLPREIPLGVVYHRVS